MSISSVEHSLQCFPGQGNEAQGEAPIPFNKAETELGREARRPATLPRPR